MKLNMRQERFVFEYLKNPNATQAALKAGYSKRTAHKIGTENLHKPAISEAIETERVKRAEAAKIDASYVLQELITLARANPIDYVQVDSKGKMSVDITKLKREQGFAIKEMTITTDTKGDQVVRVKLLDRHRTLELLGKHIDVSAYEERTTHKLDGPIEVVSGIDAAPGSKAG